MQVETWRCWSDPGYIRKVLTEIGYRRRKGEGRSASYQVKRVHPVSRKE